MSTIGPKIVLEGEKEYRQAIDNVNKSMSVLKSELNAVSAEFEGNANSLEALRKKNEIFNKQQEEQEKRIKLLRGALENAAKQYGENSKQVQDWQIKLNNANAYLLKLNREIEDNKKYMKEAEQATDKTATSIDKYGKQINEAAQKTSIFGDILKANLVSDAISDGIRKLASLLGDSIEQSIELASDLEEVQNVVDVTFGEGASNIDIWAESMGKAHGVSVLFSKQFAGTMGSMLKSMDVTDDKVIEMSKNLVQLAGDMASFYNIDVEEAFTKIRSGISGETEPLKQLGINLNLANLEAYALSEGIKKAYSEMSQAEQVTLRYNYLLKATADAQGDFARNIDSLANQQRIQDLQREEILMKLGEAVIPSVTKATAKLNEAMDGMGDKMAEVAEVLAEGVVDAFVWLIDNADTVAAGLKGIAAAIITKKAGDGIAYVIKVYKDLKTATEAATASQVAYNVASKANVYVAIASAIIGVATALASYAENAEKAALEANELYQETKKLHEETEKLNDEITKSIEDRQKEVDELENKHEVVKRLSNTLYELADKETKSNSEKAQMISLVKQINEIMPDLNLVLDENTWLLNKNTKEVNDLIDANLELQRVQLAGKRIAETELNIISIEKEIAALKEKGDVLRDEIETYKEIEKQASAAANQWDRPSASSILSGNYQKEIKIRTDLLKENQEQVDNLNISLEKLTGEYETYMDYIGDHTALDEVTKSLDGFAEKYKKVLDAQTSAEIGSLEDRQNKIRKVYDQAAKELEKQLRAEEKAFTKSQEKRVEEVQKAQEKELDALEKAHKEKLKLIDNEYMAKLKIVDEDRYRELKKIQDQIDDIDAQQEAEDRALQARENAEKEAEIKARIESAKTIEERMDALKELQEHEEKVSRERLKEERSLQKDILKQQKETINDTFDEKVKAIEEEKKKEQEKLEEQLKNEKEAINERYKLKVEAIKEEQDLERDAFKDRQNEYKEFLKEQKDLALENAKEIYEEDLAKFKLNQALKYDEVVSSEEQIKKVMKDYAYSLMRDGQIATGRAILDAKSIDEMMKYYNPSTAVKSSVPQTTYSIDYSLIENAMTNAMKKLNLTIQIDKKTLGQVIDERISYNIR